MWPYSAYNKFAVEKFRPLEFNESLRRWGERTVGGRENPLGSKSIEVGERIRQGMLQVPSTVRIPASAIIKRGSGPIITKTFEVVTPFEAPVVRTTNTFFVVTDPDEPSVRILVPNHLLDTSPIR